MRIHTNGLDHADVELALQRAKRDGQVAADVYFVVGPTRYGSKSHDRAYEVQLGTYEKGSGPNRSRHFKNSGTRGAADTYAATYDEWGWFLRWVFIFDPNAKAGQYNGRDEFNAITKCAYRTTVDEGYDSYQSAYATGRYQGD